MNTIITPHLRFDREAKEAAEFYVSLFGGNSQVKSSTIIPDTPSGDAESVALILRGQEFLSISARGLPGHFFR